VTNQRVRAYCQHLIDRGVAAQKAFDDCRHLTQIPNPN
jgi:hypothetical protein